MKTYTIEQIKKYLLTQDSLGDAHYNLNRIDEFLAIKEVFEFDDHDELCEFLGEISNNQGNKFKWEGITYEISCDVDDFIDEHGKKNFNNINYDIKLLLHHELIFEV